MGQGQGRTAALVLGFVAVALLRREMLREAALPPVAPKSSRLPKSLRAEVPGAKDAYRVQGQLFAAAASPVVEADAPVTKVEPPRYIADLIRDLLDRLDSQENFVRSDLRVRLDEESDGGLRIDIRRNSSLTSNRENAAALSLLHENIVKLAEVKGFPQEAIHFQLNGVEVSNLYWEALTQGPEPADLFERTNGILR
ncbi:MAG: hypothetical protein JST16_18855 [Bdellovibrionales bacterium]|nr:hypothetical protein [Bdellovibrionales bacterium]